MTTIDDISLVKRLGFSLQKQSQVLEPSQNLDLSCKMDLDLWDCFVRE